MDQPNQIVTLEIVFRNTNNFTIASIPATARPHCILTSRDFDFWLSESQTDKKIKFVIDQTNRSYRKVARALGALRAA